MSPDRASRVLIDTSAWVDALRSDGSPEVREKVRAATIEGTAVLCDMVLLELWNGARGDAEGHFLMHLQNEIEIVETSPQVWRSAQELARGCRSQGITIPATDLLIAACARTFGLVLLHNDRHFDLLAGDAEPLS